jgi:osmotically-inducible protein OsmY
MDHAGEKTREVASTAKHKTEHAMDRAGDRTRETASVASQKTENAMDRAGEKTRDTASTVADKTDRAAGETTRVASDSAITTKVKAFMFTEPDLKSLAIHVKTEQGVVMLSGFVDSKAEADKAIEVAKKVDGVAEVKSAIKVK